MKKIVFVLIICLSLAACGNNETAQASSSEPYFNITAFLDDQITDLVQRQANLTKVMHSSNLKDSVSLNTLKESDWKEQLRLFYEADISKPGFEGAYFVETLPALNGNVKTIYTSKKGGATVEVIEVEKQKQSDNLVSISIQIGKKNNIFVIERTLKLKIEDGVLTGFSINGQENMKLKEEMTFEVYGTIT